MARTLVRDIRSVLVGTSSTFLLPERSSRVLTFVGAPPPLASPVVAQSILAQGVAISTTGVKLSYTVPAGSTGRLTGWSYFSSTGTATIVVSVVRGGTTVILQAAGSSLAVTTNVPLSGGDTVTMSVSTAGGAGQTGDFQLGIETYQAGPRISLGFGTAAVLDQGLTIYAGQLPLILPGPALDTEIYAVADAAGRQVNVVDLFYP